MTITVEPFIPRTKGVPCCSGCFKPSDDLRTIRAEWAMGSITLCPACRTELCGMLVPLTEPATVGSFVAFDRVAEFCVPEESIVGAGWWQVRPDGMARCWRPDACGGPRWSFWLWRFGDTSPELLPLPCRLVPLALADADPATRNGGDRGSR